MTGRRHPARLTGAGLRAGHGLTVEPAAPASQVRFPDGAHFRIEIPSCEGPDVLRAIVGEASAREVTVNRVSQGSGAMLQSEAELAEMARIAADGCAGPASSGTRSMTSCGPASRESAASSSPTPGCCGW
jgi:hypothetical protein